MASDDNQIDKPQRGRPKRAELPDVNINTAHKALILRELLLSPSFLLSILDIMFRKRCLA